MSLKKNRLVGLLALAVSAVLFGADTAPTTAPKGHVPADQSHIRLDPKTGQPIDAWMKHHQKLVDQAKKGGVDLYFEGDSITDFWTSDNARHGGKALWEKEFAGWNAGDFGISGDRTEHVLWRLDNGELDGVSPKAIVLMIGTNNTGDCTSEEIANGVTAIVNKFKEKEPQAKILLLGIFPRGANEEDKRRKVNEGANAIISKLDDGKQVKYLDFGKDFLDADGTLSKEIMPDLLHPNLKGYQIWADAIRPTLTEWLGAPATTGPAN
jgi:lysophospholipase L1-like esterase